MYDQDLPFVEEELKAFSNLLLRFVINVEDVTLFDRHIVSLDHRCKIMPKSQRKLKYLQSTHYVFHQDITASSIYEKFGII